MFFADRRMIAQFDAATEPFHRKLQGMGQGVDRFRHQTERGFADVDRYAQRSILSLRSVGAASSATAITEQSGQMTYAAGKRFGRFRFLKMGDGATSAEFGMPELRFVADSVLIKDGAVTAAKILAGAVTTDKLDANAVTSEKVNTASFAASGLALFGGTVKSSNFAAGSTGWRIQENGNAEFNSLVVRSWLQEGAVSDGPNQFWAGPYASQASARPNGVQHTFTFAALGRAIDVDDHFLYAVGCETRPGNGNQTVTVALERRIMTSGAWGSWAVTDSFQRAGSTSWVFQRIQNTWAFRAEDVQFQIVVSYVVDSADYGAGDNSYDIVRNLRGTIRAVKR